MYISPIFNAPSVRKNNNLVVKKNDNSGTTTVLEQPSNIGFKGVPAEIYKKILSDPKLLTGLGVLASSLLYNIKGSGIDDIADYATEVFGKLVEKSEVVPKCTNKTYDNDETTGEIEDEVLIENKSNLLNFVDDKSDETEVDFERIPEESIPESGDIVPNNLSTNNSISDDEIRVIGQAEEVASEQKHSEENDNKIELFKPEIESLSKPVVVNKIDLSAIKDRRKVTTMPILQSGESGDELYQIARPGTLPTNVHKYLDFLHLSMKNIIKKKLETDKRIYNVRRFPVNHVAKTDVINQIEKYRDFKNITHDNAELVTEVLNSGEFTNLFSLHGAMRLLDRYADFNSDVDLEEQAKSLIETLNDGIIDSIHCGTVFSINSSKNKKDDGETEYYNPNLIIDPDKLSDGVKDDFISKFGSLPINIGIAYKKNMNGESVISTIFTQNAID